VADATDAALVEPTRPAGGRYSLGVDLGLTHDLTAVVLSHVDERGRLVVDLVRSWRGTTQTPVDLASVETTIRELAQRFQVATVHLDQWQGAFMAQRLSQQGVGVRVHTIESSKLDAYASLLKTLFQSRQIRVPALPDLIEQLESIEGEELTRRDRVRFTSGPGGHDDLVVALCLSTETFVRWRTGDGQMRLIASALGRAPLAEIAGCRAAARLGRSVACPLDDGPSAQPGCLECAAYQSAHEAQARHLATGGAWEPLPRFVDRRMSPCRWLLERRVSRIGAAL
jgi:hypothetical protein